MKRPRHLIRGPVLIGFMEAFSEASGRDDTPRPYVKVTPSRVGPILLPFKCPHCSAVRAEVVDARKRNAYRDNERGFSWCPACRMRYVINPTGTLLADALPAGASYAPALVDRGDGKPALVGMTESSFLDAFGVHDVP